MSVQLPIAGDPHMTPGPDKTFEQRLMATYPGMAHLAGSGPPGRTCRECVFFRGRDYYAKTNKKYPNQLKPAHCEKYRELMRKTPSWPEVPHFAAACRHFTENLTPPDAQTK